MCSDISEKEKENKTINSFKNPREYIKYEYNRLGVKMDNLDTIDLEAAFQLLKDKYGSSQSELFNSDQILFKKLKKINDSMKIPIDEQDKITYWLLNRHSENIINVAKKNNIYVPENIILATLPFEDLDAFKCEFSNGQKLVVLNQGVFSFLYFMGRVISSFFTKISEDNKTDSMSFDFNKDIVLKNINTNEDAHIRFMEGLILFFEHKDLLLSNIYFHKDQNLNLSGVFWDTAELFTVAHEYSHIILDSLNPNGELKKEHIDKESISYKITRNWNEEFSADELSFKLTMAHCNQNHKYEEIRNCYMGIEFLFACLDIIEKAFSIEFSETHPTSKTRIGKLREYLSKHLPQKGDEIISESKIIPYIIDKLWEMNKDEFYLNIRKIREN